MREDIPQIFEREIHNSFDEFLKDYGFSRTRSVFSHLDFTVVYRKEEQYILIGGTVKPEDYPFYFYISFGEGSDQLPMSEWNAVAFWRIMQKVSPEDYGQYLHIFEIAAGIKEEDIVYQVSVSRELCAICGREFLEGDLEMFRVARSEQNRDREPHKIYVLDPDGNYRLTFEEEGRLLKEKYS